jgi:hypothetical protein
MQQGKKRKYILLWQYICIQFLHLTPPWYICLYAFIKFLVILFKFNITWCLTVLQN